MRDEARSKWKKELSQLESEELWRQDNSLLPVLASVPDDLKLSINADLWDGHLVGRAESYCWLSGLAHGASWALSSNPMAALSNQMKATNTYTAAPPFALYRKHAALIFTSISKSLISYRQHLES